MQFFTDSSNPLSTLSVLLQNLQVVLRWPAVFFKKLLVLFYNRVQLFANLLKTCQVIIKSNEVEAPLGKLLGIEHLGGESGVHNG